MKRLILVTLFLALPLPAWAGVAYIPFVANTEIHGYQVETRLLVANEGNRNRGFTALFIPAGTDGSALDRTGLPRRFVAPLTLEAITGLVPEGGIGMLEINGAPQLSVSAELVLVEGDRRTPLGPVPAVLPGDTLREPQVTQVRFHVPVDYARETALFGAVNLTRPQQVATCSIAVFKDEPSPAGIVSRSHLVPSASVEIEEVQSLFSDLNSPAPPTGRGRSQCLGPGPFYFYAVVFGWDRPSVRFVEDLGRTMLSGGF